MEEGRGGVHRTSHRGRASLVHTYITVNIAFYLNHSSLFFLYFLLLPLPQDINRKVHLFKTKSWTIESQTPTRSLCLSSVLVVFLQPGCQTVDPEEGDRE